MPKGFSSKEKASIENKLYEVGLQLFGNLGLKKTGIGDITKEVGIAQGSFYLFFSSKEELYFRILEKEEALLKNALKSQLSYLEENPAKYIKELILVSVNLLKERPILMQLYTDNSMESLVRKLPEEILAQHFQEDNSHLLPLLNSWHEKNLILDIKPELITSLVRSVFLMTLHRKEIGEFYFDDTLSLLADMIGSGLVRRA